jgi:transcriptional regulator with XRE-family HTH domain
LSGDRDEVHRECVLGDAVTGKEIVTVAIHEILKKTRICTELTLEEAATAIGISGASFSRMENGISQVTTDRLAELASLYQLSASALVEGNIVTRPTSIDMKCLTGVVEAVQGTVNRLGVIPMGMAVGELYRLEIDHIINHPDAKFDANRHLGIIEAMFTK